MNVYYASLRGNERTVSLEKQTNFGNVPSSSSSQETEDEVLTVGKASLREPGVQKATARSLWRPMGEGGLCLKAD